MELTKAEESLTVAQTALRQIEQGPENQEKFNKALRTYDEKMSKIASRADSFAEKASTDPKFDSILDQYTKNQLEQQLILDEIMEQAPARQKSRVQTVKEKSLKSFAEVLIKMGDLNKLLDRLFKAMDQKNQDEYSALKDLEILEALSDNMPAEAQPALEKIKTARLFQLNQKIKSLPLLETKKLQPVVKKLKVNEQLRSFIAEKIEVKNTTAAEKNLNEQEARTTVKYTTPEIQTQATSTSTYFGSAGGGASPINNNENLINEPRELTDQQIESIIRNPDDTQEPINPPMITPAKTDEPAAPSSAPLAPPSTPNVQSTSDASVTDTTTKPVLNEAKNSNDDQVGNTQPTLNKPAADPDIGAPVTPQASSPVKSGSTAGKTKIISPPAKTKSNPAPSKPAQSETQAKPQNTQSKTDAEPANIIK